MKFMARSRPRFDFVPLNCVHSLFFFSPFFCWKIWFKWNDEHIFVCVFGILKFSFKYVGWKWLWLDNAFTMKSASIIFCNIKFILNNWKNIFLFKYLRKVTFLAFLLKIVIIWTGVFFKSYLKNDLKNNLNNY